MLPSAGKLHGHILGNNGVVALHGALKNKIRAALNALVCPFVTLIRAYVVFVGKMAGQIGHAEIHSFGKIERLERFHKIVRHFLRAVNRDVVKAHAAAAQNAVVAGLGVIVILIRPETCARCVVSRLGVGVGVKQPEGNIHALYLINVVFTFEQLRQELLAGKVLFQGFLCGLLIKLEGNDIVRLQLARKLRFKYGGIAAEWAACRCRCLLRDYLAAAALADIDAHTVAVAVKTLLFVVRYPLHVVGLIIFQAFIIAFERFKLKLGVAIRAFHFPGCAVVGYEAAAAGTFILNGILRFHKHQTLSLSLNGSPHFGQNFGGCD